MVRAWCAAHNNHSETMQRISRRSFLAGSAALAATPVLGAVSPSGEPEVVIVGAGVAGIAAARKLAAAGKRFAVFEAADRIGGRCFTDSEFFGVPYDRGARWIHLPDANPLAQLAPRTGLEVYAAPRGQTVRIGRRNARMGELEYFLAALVRSNRAIADAARGRTDISCLRALPRDLGEWRETISFVLGPYQSTQDIAEISAIDFARSIERTSDAFCRQGLGALVAKLADGIPVQLRNPVTRIGWGSRNRFEVETAGAKLSPQAVIVTASTGVLNAGKIAFDPELPKKQRDALRQLPLGSYDHIMLELPGNPLELQNDDLVFEKSVSTRTAAILGNVAGTNLCMLDVAGSFGRALSARGETAMVTFALDWLASLYGDEVKKAVRRTHATRWNHEPWALGAASVAMPGGQGARQALMEPLGRRIFFAGEAVHETLWGTVGGAWESGERAAEAAIKAMTAPPKPERKQRQPSRRGRRRRR
jgi:monoamine oxidase